MKFNSVIVKLDQSSYKIEEKILIRDSKLPRGEWLLMPHTVLPISSISEYLNMDVVKKDDMYVLFTENQKSSSRILRTLVDIIHNLPF